MHKCLRSLHVSFVRIATYIFNYLSVNVAKFHFDDLSVLYHDSYIKVAQLSYQKYTYIQCRFYFRQVSTTNPQSTAYFNCFQSYSTPIAKSPTKINRLANSWSSVMSSSERSSFRNGRPCPHEST